MWRMQMLLGSVWNCMRSIISYLFTFDNKVLDYILYPFSSVHNKW